MGILDRNLPLVFMIALPLTANAQEIEIVIPDHLQNNKQLGGFANELMEKLCTNSKFECSFPDAGATDNTGSMGFRAFLEPVGETANGLYSDALFVDRIAIAVPTNGIGELIGSASWHDERQVFANADVAKAITNFSTQYELVYSQALPAVFPQHANDLVLYGYTSDLMSLGVKGQPDGHEYYFPYAESLDADHSTDVRYGLRFDDNGDSEIVSKFNTALTEIINDGTYFSLNNTWLDIPVMSAANCNNTTNWFAPLAAASEGQSRDGATQLLINLAKGQ